MARKQTIAFKISGESKEELRERAFMRGMTLSEYLEREILEKCLLDEHSCNGGGEVLSADEINQIAASVAAALGSGLPGHHVPAEKFNTTQILSRLPITAALVTDLANYIDQASFKIGITEDQVVARMLYYAYEKLKPERSYVNESLADVDLDDNLQYPENYWDEEE